MERTGNAQGTEAHGTGISADNVTREMTFVEWANKIRKDIKRVAAEAKAFKERTVRRSKTEETDGVEDTGEMIANLTLAYRHLEDASQRLGKAIQAKDGGVSVYDRATTVGA